MAAAAGAAAAQQTDAASGAPSEEWSLRTFRASGHALELYDGSVGAGVGMGAWSGALEMCAELCCRRRREQLALGRPGARVLELGAGTGLVGLFCAAFLGATDVVLSDYNGDGPVMRILKANADRVVARLAAERAEREERVGSCDKANSPPARCEVATLDWLQHEGVDLDTLRCMLEFAGEEGALEALERAAEGGGDGNDAGDSDGSGDGGPWAPLSRELRFDVLLAAECVYEWPGAVCLPAVVRHRMMPGGCAFILNAVRQQAMFETFLAGLRSEGLRVAAVAQNSRVDPTAGEGLAGAHSNTATSSGAGYLLVLADRADAPCERWGEQGPDPEAGLVWLDDSSDLAAIIEGQTP